MNTYAICRQYLKAREKILIREMSDAGARANDGRATIKSERDWRDCFMFAQAELDLVRQALAELPPAHE